MKPIEYPVEAFQWHKLDQLGNVHFEIRDKNKATVFYMRINGREYGEAIRFEKEIVPLIVRLMNDEAKSNVVQVPIPEVSKPQPEPVETHPTPVTVHPRSEQREGEKLEKTKRKYTKRK